MVAVAEVLMVAVVEVELVALSIILHILFPLEVTTWLLETVVSQE